MSPYGQPMQHLSGKCNYSNEGRQGGRNTPEEEFEAIYDTFDMKIDRRERRKEDGTGEIGDRNLLKRPSNKHILCH